MIKIKNLIKENVWLLSIIIFAAALRVYGIYFDFPGGTNYINDELDNIMQLFNIIETKNLLSTSHYPALLTILYAPAVFIKALYLMLINHLRTVTELKDFVLQSGMGHFYILTRWFSVFFGVASVYLIYKIYYLFQADKFAACLAAFTAAAMINPVFLSHWGKAHSAMAFFLLWSLFFALKFEISKNQKFLYLSSLLAACSMGTHYLGISALIFPVFAVVKNYQELGWNKIIRTGLIGFFSSLFFYALNFAGVVGMFKYIGANNYSKTGFSGLIKVGLIERFTYLFRDSFYLEPVLLSLAVIIIFFYFKSLWRDRLKSYLLAGIIFNYLLTITIIVGPKITRFSLIFMFLLFPLAIFTLAEFLLKKFNKKIAATIILAFLLPSLAYSVKWNLIASKYTAVEAARWLEKNTKQSDSIYSYYSILYLPFSYEAAVWNNENNAMSNKKIDYIIKHPEQFKDKGYNLFYDNYKNRFKDLAGQNTDFVVISYNNMKEKAELLSKLEAHNSLFLLKEFRPLYDDAGGVSEEVTDNPQKWQNIFNYKMAGPFIEIYKVNLSLNKFGTRIIE